MWSLYVNSKEGIAIQTTFKEFKECFNKTEREVFIGKVKYIDYEIESIGNQDILSPFVHKRKSFKHENELRAVLCELPNDYNFDNVVYEFGSYIEIDIHKLIQNVYVSPLAPKWFYELVKSTISRFNFNFNVIQSNLYDKPIY